jgi:hypothetical protein
MCEHPESELKVTQVLSQLERHTKVLDIPIQKTSN